MKICVHVYDLVSLISQIQLYKDFDLTPTMILMLSFLNIFLMSDKVPQTLFHTTIKSESGQNKLI
jgi:hypothetical protein